MWAMVAFLAALSALFFDKTTAPTRVTVALVEGFVVMLILWCIWFAWSEEDGKDLSSSLCTNFTNVLSNLRLVAQERRRPRARRVVENDRRGRKDSIKGTVCDQPIDPIALSDCTIRTRLV
jgi:hypothetical protein